MAESREGWSSTKGRFNLNTDKMILISQISFRNYTYLKIDCRELQTIAVRLKYSFYLITLILLDIISFKQQFYLPSFPVKGCDIYRTHSIVVG